MQKKATNAEVFPDSKKIYAKNPKIKLGFWKILGLAHPIRYLLEYIEHPYDDVMYELGDASSDSIECWTSAKNELGLAFPNMPYMLDGETKLTKSIAIMVYYAIITPLNYSEIRSNKKADVDMLYSQMKDIKSFITGPCFSQN